MKFLKRCACLCRYSFDCRQQFQFFSIKIKIPVFTLIPVGHRPDGDSHTGKYFNLREEIKISVFYCLTVFPHSNTLFIYSNILLGNLALMMYPGFLKIQLIQMMMALTFMKTSFSNGASGWITLLSLHHFFGDASSPPLMFLILLIAQSIPPRAN